MATPHSAATDAAAEAFSAGGNAIDAALAAATSLAVVYPHMCGVGGDLLALVRQPDGEVTAIVSAGRAPLATDVEAVRARHTGTMPTHGPDAITVPGAVAGWEALHRSGAALEWAAALEPAIARAREGVAVAPNLAATLASEGERLRTDPGVAGVFFPDGQALAPGDTLAQPRLAESLEMLAAEGAQAMYSGDLGARYAAGLAARGCPMTSEDLAGHLAETVEPVKGAFRDTEVLTAPPPSQGYVLLQVLALIDRLDLDPDPLGADVATLALLFAATSAGRDRDLADPDHMRVNPAELLSTSRLGGLAESIAAPPHHTPTGDTIALVTADSEGRCVSLIQSLYDGFGSGILEPSTGIVAHDRGGCFTLEPGHPNELAPGKRPLHTLMPVLVQREGRPAAVVGTMGGEVQPQINAQNILRVLAMGMNPADALAAPRWCAEAASAGLEADVPVRVADALVRAGFIPERMQRHEGSIGHSAFIRCEPAGFTAAADPRADGSACAH